MTLSMILNDTIAFCKLETKLNIRTPPESTLPAHSFLGWCFWFFQLHLLHHLMRSAFDLLKELRVELRCRTEPFSTMNTSGKLFFISSTVSFSSNLMRNCWHRRPAWKLTYIVSNQADARSTWSCHYDSSTVTDGISQTML